MSEEIEELKKDVKAVKEEHEKFRNKSGARVEELLFDDEDLTPLVAAQSILTLIVLNHICRAVENGRPPLSYARSKSKVDTLRVMN